MPVVPGPPAALLTVEQAGERLGITSAEVFQLIVTGELAALKLPGKAG